MLEVGLTLMTQASDAESATRKKVAISYSWTTPDHKEWVRRLAERLIDTNVDVVLDIWELDFGDDTIHWMERFVNDKSIDRVLLVCDSAYAQKANAREGGVGIETQIISPSVYGKTTHSRFIPVVTGVDAEGKATLPTYMNGRWYVDLTTQNRYEENFQALVFSIEGKALFKKPAFGKRPSYLDEEGDTQLVTVHKARTAIEAIRNEKRTAPGMFGDYLETFRDFLKDGQLSPFSVATHPIDIADATLGKAEALLPYKNEFIEIIYTLGRYGIGQTNAALDSLHDFFNSLIPLMHAQELIDPRYDSGRFVVHELFISCVAVLLRASCFNEASYLLEQEYLDPDVVARYRGDDYLGLSNFNAFDGYLRSFELAASSGQATNAYSVQRLVLERCRDTERLTADDLINADAALYARGLTTAKTRFAWQARMVHNRRGVDTVSIFQKAASRTFFERFKRVLNTESSDDFRKLIHDLGERKQLYGFARFPDEEYEAHERLFNLPLLATR